MPISARLVRILVTLNTTFLLMAQYNGKAIVPLADVCRDYFSHLAPEKLFRKAMAGQIPLLVVHIEHSPKSAKGIHLQDLADYLDKRRAAVTKECAQLHGTG